MRQILILTLFVLSYNIIHSQTSVTPADITNFQSGITQARENDLYLETTNNLYYIGLSNGKVKFIQDTIRINSTLTGNGSIVSPIGIAQQSATSGQVLSWNGSAWIPSNAAPATTTVSNTVTAPNSIRTTVNGVDGSNVNIVTGVSNSSTVNSFSTTVNGVTGTGVPIINSVSNAINTGQLTTTVNGISSSALTLPIADGSETKINSGTNTTVSGSGTTGTPYVVAVADATTAIKGVVQLTGDLTGSATSPQIATSAVTSSKILDGTVANADLANMPALTIKGNSTNTTAVPTDIAAGTDGHVLRRSGTTLSFGQVATSGISDNAITYGKMQNVTAQRLLGNPTGSAAIPSEISLGTGLSFSGSVLNATNSGTVTNVSGTSPISVANGTTTPVVSITRNNIVAGTSSNGATSPLTLDAGATNAVVGGANATLTINNTAPLWNANQLQGRPISTTTPTTGQILRYDGTNWTPITLPQVLVDVDRTSNYTPASAYATIIYNSASINIGSAYNTTTGVFTAPATGLYHVLVHNIYDVNNAANNYLRGRIMVNTDINLECVVLFTPYSGTVYNSMNMSTIVSMTSGQTLRIEMGGELGTVNTEVGTGQHNLKIIRLN